jgi:hypothetical protein
LLMRTKDLEAQEHHTPVVRKAVAGLVLAVVAVLAISLVIAFVKAIFVTVVVIAAVLGVLWALKTLFW